jgi:uncharacterized protein
MATWRLKAFRNGPRLPHFPGFPMSTPASFEPAPLTPVKPGERFLTIDVLRGFALLGILVINIWLFGLPDTGVRLSNPLVVGGEFTGANFAVWLVSHLLFEMKMMSLFSLLFGAGLVVMTERADARGSPLTGVYYRRIAWLLVFGLLHAYLLWEGDILVSYALCGIVLFPFRRLAPRALIILGLCVFLVPLPLDSAAGLTVASLQDTRANLAEGESLPPFQRFLWDVLTDDGALLEPQKDLAKTIEHYRAPYWELFTHRAGINVWDQTVGFVLDTGWRAGGLMLLGMGLMKLGVFSGARPPAFYRKLAAVGYGVGLPLVGYGAWCLVRHDFDPVYELKIGGHYNYIGSLLVALGHVGLLVWVCQRGWLRGLLRCLAAVGRTALSNYLLTTLICTTIFFGWGFQQFGALNRVQLAGVVVAIWCLQLVVSPRWLRYFRFGPMEWLWRSLTYGERQPFFGAT